MSQQLLALTAADTLVDELLVVNSVTPADEEDISLVYVTDDGQLIPLATIQSHFTKAQAKALLALKADLVNGKVPASQLPAVANPLLDLAYVAAKATTSTTTLDVAGRLVADWDVSLQSATTLVLTNVPNGFTGTIKVTNVMQNPIGCALPAGCYGPKNYNSVLAPNELRLLGVTQAGPTLCINAQTYYPQ